MSHVIHTIGYEKRSLGEYFAILVEAQIDVLVDVRQTAWSYKPGFSKKPLADECERHGMLYVHADFVGNPKALRAGAKSHAACLAAYGDYISERDDLVRRFEALVDDFLSQGARLSLTCFERHYDDCHRSIIADAWMTRDSRRGVEHLAFEGCPRLIPQPLATI